MLQKFNKFISLFLEDDNLIPNQDQIQFKDQTIAIVPGSFKPPHKGHWQMVMHYVPLADKVIVLISNISTTAISSRNISLTNLKPIGKIQKFAKQKNLDKVNDIFEDLNKNIQTMNFSSLSNYFDQICKICYENIKNDKNYIQLKARIIKYKDDLESTIFKSIRKAGNKQITPQDSKKIFEIFANAYGVSDKVIIKVSSSPSPITDTLEFVNYKCKNCKILLGVSKKGGDQARWNGIQKSVKNDTVQVIPDPVEVKTMLSATDLRNNISNLKKQYFPDKLSDSDFEKIVNILN